MTDANLTSIAPLRNVGALLELVMRVKDRPPNLPGLATFSGPSGYGKSMAAIYTANRTRAYHVQCKSVWTRKSLCQAILAEMGIRPAGTIPGLVDQIGEQLSLSGRPLLIDEADHLVGVGRSGTGGLIEVVRDIYESSQSTIVLIGEEGLPQKLQPWERVHGRMLDWVQAQPASLADARHLAKLYARGTEIADDLLAALHDAAAGSARRVSVNCDRVREFAQTRGLATVDLAAWTDGGQEFFSGRPPARRQLERTV